MFDGTDLSLVYGEPVQPQSFPQQQPPQQSINQAQVPPTAPPPPMPEVVYMKEAQPPQQQQQQQQSSASFWDRMGMKKDEIYKLLIFSMIILLAIAMDKAFFYYLKTYIEENMLTWSQEFMLRFTYPIVILVVLWIMKAL